MRLSFTALCVLNFLVERIDQDHSIPQEVCPREDLVSVHHELVEQGLVVEDDRMAGDPYFALSPQKRPQARTLAKKYRQAAIQLEILEKVEGNSDRGSTDDYYPPASVRGEPVTKPEYERALEHLTEWRLIKGTKTWGSGLIRPELTPNGAMALESGYAPQDWVQGQNSPAASQRSAMNTMNNYGPVGAAQQGDHNIANVTQNVGFDAESFSAAMRGIRDLLQEASLEPEDLADANTQLEMIEQQVESGAPKERIQGFFRLFSKALPAALASQTAVLITQALGALGIG